MSIPHEHSASERRIDLDWVRIAAFGLLILYHVGMLYVSWGFHIKSVHRLVWLEPLMLAVNPWRLSLLFLVSGVATRFMLSKYDRFAFFGARSARLLIPLIFGMLVVVPPQSYDQVVESLGYPQGFIDFYVGHYLAFALQFCPGPCILLPTWNHLWFVAYLWVYSSALICVVAMWPAILDRLEAGLAATLAGRRLLVVPCILFATWRVVLLPLFPSTHALFGDWYNHADYATVFLFGCLLARRRDVWCDVERQRRAALAAAVVVFAVFLLLGTGHGAMPAPPPALKAAAAIAYGCYQWLGMAAALGFARRHFTADGPLRRYLTDAIFPYYIVHQTAIIMIAHALRGSGLSAVLEAGLIVGGTVLMCVITYEIVRRIAWLRPLFGLRLARRLPVGNAGHQAA
jgi:hypothetical protein